MEVINKRWWPFEIERLPNTDWKDNPKPIRGHEDIQQTYSEDIQT